MTVAIVSTYYPSYDGVATYIQYLYEEGLKLDQNVFIIANKVEEVKQEPKNIHRVWTKGIFTFPSIIKEIVELHVTVVHFQHEFFLYGAPVNALLFPFALLITRVMGKKVVTTIHGVPDPKDIDREFIKENFISIPSFFVRLGFLFIIALINLFSNKVIVHEELFRKRLIQYYFGNPSKIDVIHHIVHKIKKYNKKKACEEFNLNSSKKNILYFGYLTGYKGVDELVCDFSKLCKKHKNWNLVIAGGKPLRMTKNREYERWYASLIKNIKKNKQIKLMDFVPKEKVGMLFSASNLIVLPYKTLLSASGPLALAMGANKSFVLSSKFKGIGFDELCYQDTKSLEKLICTQIGRTYTTSENRTVNHITKQHKIVWFH